MSWLCSDSLKLGTPANQAEEHKETVARNILHLLVTDMSKVSIGKADSRIGLLTVRTSIKGDRGALRCDTPKVRPHVTTRREVTKLKVSGLPHIRNQMFERTWVESAGLGWKVLDLGQKHLDLSQKRWTWPKRVNLLPSQVKSSQVQAGLDRK